MNALSPIKPLLFRFSLLLACLTLIFSSCNKSDRDADVETLSAREYTISMLTYESIFSEIHHFALHDSILNSTGFSFSNNGCIRSARLNKPNASFPVTLSLNFDSTQCNDEIIRGGKITAKFSGKYLEAGTEVSVTLKDFYMQDRIVEGSCTLTNLGKNSAGNWKFLWTVDDGRLNAFNTDINFDGSHTMVWDDGSDSPENIEDDVFIISSGSATGRNSRGTSFLNEITGNYTRELNCIGYSEGRSRLEVTNLTPKTLNYGEGECDQILVVRRNNTYFETEIVF